ncbi:Potassium channel [Boothiomyces sp. JEL0866]|nr:Potassium channel [Boothiomyces sp. JEL0866]
MFSFNDFFEKNQYLAMKPYFYSNLASNFAFLCIVRSIGQSTWIITSPYDPEQISNPYFGLQETQLQRYTLGFCILTSVVNEICIRVRSLGYKEFLMTCVMILCDSSQITLLIINIKRWTDQFPVYQYDYSPGGFNASCSALIATCISFILILSDLIYFRRFKLVSGEQSKYELANFLLYGWILVGALVFSFVESWTFETSGIFCLMTLLTIGYGGLVPLTLLGKWIMFIFTSVGLFLIGFCVLDYEEVIVADTRMYVESQQEDLAELPMDRSESNSSLRIDGLRRRERYNSVPTNSIPLEQFPTFTSILQPEQKTPFRYTLLLVVGRLLVFWMLSSTIFMITEPGWQFIDGMYFAFVTMTGIGFGNYVLKSPISNEFCWIFLFNAISLLASAGNAITDKINGYYRDNYRQRYEQKIRKLLDQSRTVAVVR